MEDRISRERNFHNATFATGSRAPVQRFYAVTRKARDRYLHLLDTAVKRSSSVLEYGCGKGGYAFHLAEKGASVVGIDISEVAIEQARRKSGSLGLSTEFLVMDAERLTFGENSFDVVCGEAILHHLDLDRAFQEIARVAKPSGTCLFMEPLGHNPIINLFRKLTPQFRSLDEHPLLMRDLDLARKYFAEVSLSCFTLSSLCTLPLLNLPGYTKLLGTMDNADEYIFTHLPFARRFAWIAIVRLSSPLR
jgi:SAM-dependent methyltransferase